MIDISPFWASMIAIGTVWLTVVVVVAILVRSHRWEVVPPAGTEDPGAPEFWADPGPRHPDHGKDVPTHTKGER